MQVGKERADLRRCRKPLRLLDFRLLKKVWDLVQLGTHSGRPGRGQPAGLGAASRPEHAAPAISRPGPVGLTAALGAELPAGPPAADAGRLPRLVSRAPAEPDGRMTRGRGMRPGRAGQPGAGFG